MSKMLRCRMLACYLLPDVYLLLTYFDLNQNTFGRRYALKGKSLNSNYVPDLGCGSESWIVNRRSFNWVRSARRSWCRYFLRPPQAPITFRKEIHTRPKNRDPGYTPVSKSTWRLNISPSIKCDHMKRHRRTVALPTFDDLHGDGENTRWLNFIMKRTFSLPWLRARIGKLSIRVDRVHAHNL